MSWTFAKVVGRMLERRKTGVLLVISADGEVRIHLHEGVIVAVDDPIGRPEQLRRFLLHSGTLDPGDLTRHERRAEGPLEEHLVRAGALSDEAMGRFVALCARETLLGLFPRSGVTCQMTREAPGASRWMTPIPIPWLLKEAGRRAERWPELHRAIPAGELVFDKVEEHVSAVLGSDAADLSASDRAVYLHVNGVRTAEQLAFASCQGEFETWAALVNLKTRGLIRPVASAGPGEQLRPHRVVLSGVIRGLAWGLAALVVAGLAVVRPGALAEPEVLAAPLPPALQGALRRQSAGRLRDALELYRAVHGGYPSDPAALAEAALLPAAEVDALSRAFRLRMVDGGRAVALEPRRDVWH